MLMPVGVWSYTWLDRQTLLARHRHALEDMRVLAEKNRTAAYNLGKHQGISEVRDAERIELEATRAALLEMEEQLEAERGKAAEQPPTTAPLAIAPELMELCKRSASCRERRTLK